MGRRRASGGPPSRPRHVRRTQNLKFNETFWTSESCTSYNFKFNIMISKVQGPVYVYCILCIYLQNYTAYFLIFLSIFNAYFFAYRVFIISNTSFGIFFSHRVFIVQLHICLHIFGIQTAYFLHK